MTINYGYMCRNEYGPRIIGPRPIEKSSLFTHILVTLCRKCYLQCVANWHITRYEAVFSVANQLAVSERGCSLQATAI